MLKVFKSVIRNNGNNEGFSLLELLIVVAIMSTLASLAVPSYLRSIQSALNVRSIGDIKNIQMEIDIYLLTNNTLPESLDVFNLEYSMDPWGNPYEYLKIAGDKKSKGKCRKDKNLVPLNNDYDLYSKGPDGQSVSPLTAKASRDDIVRGSNGGFIGLAVDY